MAKRKIKWLKKISVVFLLDKWSWKPWIYKYTGQSKTWRTFEINWLNITIEFWFGN